MTQETFELPETERTRANHDEDPDRVRLKLVLSYDGTDFRGFAAQPDQRTVAGVLADALTKALRSEPESLDLSCAGRTDAGVHARGQVVSVAAPADTAPETVLRVVNRLCSPEIVVRSCERVEWDFDARHSARWRRYRYRILNRPVPDPFLARFAWWIPEPLDLAQLRLAADPLVGEHDFAAFCRRGPAGSTTRRRVLDSCWLPGEEGVLDFEIRARAFCWQMVRSIVGALVEAANGRRRPSDVVGLLRSGDRSRAPKLAPPTGLCLWDVGY